MKIRLFALSCTLCAALCTTSLSAATIDGVAIVINKEPITLYDVYKYSKRFNIEKKEALDILVRQKLEESEIKKLDISVTNFDVDQAIETLAISNNMSQFDFINMIKSKNIDIAEYKEELKNKLKRDKLYRHILSAKAQQVSDGELKAYYNENQNEFSQASSFDVTVYSSPNQKSLQTIQNNPMSTASDVNLQDSSISASKTDPKLLALLNKTSQGKFSEITKTEQGYVMFFVKQKNNVKNISFEDAKNYIHAKLAEGREQKGIEEYFEKLKSSANIQVVRAP